MSSLTAVLREKAHAGFNCKVLHIAKSGCETSLQDRQCRRIVDESLEAAEKTAGRVSFSFRLLSNRIEGHLISSSCRLSRDELWCILISFLLKMSVQILVALVFKWQFRECSVVLVRTKIYLKLQQQWSKPILCHFVVMLLWNWFTWWLVNCCESTKAWMFKLLCCVVFWWCSLITDYVPLCVLPGQLQKRLHSEF